MKKNCTGKLLVVLILLGVLFGCMQEDEQAHTHNGEYTCPMHPQIVREEAGDCPICGMDLVPMAAPHTTGGEVVDTTLLPLVRPTNEWVVADVPTVTPFQGTRILTLDVQGVVSYDRRHQVSVASRIGGRIESLSIRYNFQPVRKGQLLMEVYSPELVAAQREVIYVSKVDQNPSLMEKARQKLLLLGMQPAQIDKIIRSGNPLYRVPVYSPSGGYIVDQTQLSNLPSPAAGPAGRARTASDMGDGMGNMGGGGATQALPTPIAPDNSPVLLREGQYVSAGETLFTIYQTEGLVADFYLNQNLSAEVKRGHKLLYRQVANPDQPHFGFVGLIEPTQRTGQNFSIARVYLRSSDLQPGQLLMAQVPVVKKESWWLPKSAVVGLGTEAVVFRKEGRGFAPRPVATGLRANGEVQVLNDISQWRVARDASYLVDNESFIRVPADF